MMFRINVCIKNRKTRTLGSHLSAFLKQFCISWPDTRSIMEIVDALPQCKNNE